MFVTLTVSICLSVGCVLTHARASRALRALCARRSLMRHLRLGMTYSGILVVHLLTAMVFALAFAVMSALGYGSFEKEPDMSAMDLFYFSLINMTTLGLGDIYPVGHLRSMAGIEALTGFVMISCTAQLVHEVLHEDA